MVFADIVAFLKAFPALVEMISGLRQDIKDLRREKIEKELAEYKAQVSSDLKKIIGAKTNEERLTLASSLTRHISQ
jgi:Ni,Fe-hydrogenase III large subunit